MEHFIYNPGPQSLRAEVRAAAQGDFEISDWLQYDESHGYCPPAVPRISWLGHDHSNSSYYHGRYDAEELQMLPVFKDLYGKDWRFHRFLETSNIRDMNASFRSQTTSEEEHSRQTAAFLQSWLYFGLLEAILSRSISTSYLVRATEDGQTWIYSRNLPVLLEVWMKRLETLPEHVKDQKLREARACAGAAYNVLRDILEMRSDNGQAGPIVLLQALVWSIEPALSALFEAIIRFTEVHQDEDMRQVNDEIVGSPKHYIHRLIERGWCPFMVANAEESMTTSLLRYVDVIALKSPSEGHSMCTKSRCERNHVRKATYTQQHWPPSCKCEFVRPDLENIRKKLGASLIPLIEWNEANSCFGYGSIRLDEGDADYIAFSHVWADGLGSNTETGLPLCQIRRLSQLAASRLTYGSFFWIDSLCIPKQEPYRSKAIQFMKATYQNATGVIVLDNGLQGVSLESPLIETVWTVLTSGWFGRLWTYQEGMLPPRVELDVSNGLQDLSTLIRDLHSFWSEGEGNPFPAIFFRDLVGILQKARPLSSDRKHRSMQRRIVDLYNALSRRDTSRHNDQLLVMGLLLDIDIEDMLSLNGEDRWRAFYLALRQIPWTIVYDRRSKMRMDGFQWAPATWLSEGLDEWLHYDESLADITAEGLMINLKVLMLDDAQTVAFSNLYVNAGLYLYELVCMEVGGPYRIQTFTYIIIRHFPNVPPDIQLRNHDSTYIIIGLGVPNDPTGSKIQFEFMTGWGMRQVPMEEQAHLTDIQPVRGKWEQRQVCFI